MLRLGHIEYSNCFPVHALLLDRGAPPWVELRSGVPSQLNADLAAGRVDVAPSSSIEFARHAERYRLLPDLAIGSRGPVGSILLESDCPPEELDGRVVALPTASATSVVLLRLLLERRWGVRPRYRWFDQATEDPIRRDGVAALWIGDVALRRGDAVGPRALDLGAAWTEWTGLPFVYALWQTSAGPERDSELRALHDLLLESRWYFAARVEELAERHAARFGVEPGRLAAYWRSLEYGLDGDVRRGLEHFFRLAHELREVPAVPAPRWVTPPRR